MNTLYTFGPSHYCEKARWALDLCGLDYREVRWAPGPHLLSARRLAPGTTVPILRGSTGTIQGSDKIIDWLEASQPFAWSADGSSSDKEAITRIELRADDGLGVAVRRLAYATTLPTGGGRNARQLFNGVVGWQAPLARLMWPVTRLAIMKGLRATAKDAPEARAELEAELDHWDAQLADQRRFLVGNRFTRADIALASLLSPIARPPEHPVYPGLPNTAVTDQLNAAYGARPCARWATRLYRDFRVPQPRDGTPTAR